jgi:hypothetical protein
MFTENQQTEEKPFEYDNFFVQAIDGFYDQKHKNKEIFKPFRAFSKKYSSIKPIEGSEENEKYLTKNEESDLELDLIKNLDLNFELEDTNLDSNIFSESESSNADTLSIRDNYGSRTSFGEVDSKNETQEKTKFTSLLNSATSFKEEINSFKQKLEILYSLNMKRMFTLQLMTQLNFTKKIAENLKKLQN